MDSVLSAKITSNHSRLGGITISKDNIQNKILELLKIKPHTPTELANYFHQTREQFSKSYIYPLRNSKKIEKVDGSNYYQLAGQKNTIVTIQKQLRSESEIFNTNLFKNWTRKNHAKFEYKNQTRFARIVLGFVTHKFKIHPDDITKENWREVIPNMVDALLEVANYDIVDGEPNWSNRQAIRHAIKYGLGIEISENEGIQLRISGQKPKEKSSDLHITSEQIIEAKKLLSKHYSIEDYLKFGVKTWTFVRPSTVYLIELAKMEFIDQLVEYVDGADGTKLTDEKVVSYAKFKGDKIYSYVRRVCHIEVHENKTHDDFDKYILDSEFVEPLEQFYNTRISQGKKYLFWEDNNTKFESKTYDKILTSSVSRDNKFFKKILSMIGFQKSDFGLYFRANYGFRHFGIQMWLIATDYNYNLVAEMSHEGTETLKKWYGKRTQKDFQRKIKGIMVN
ncbi:MAG: hypothetical protein K8Q89_00310 [Nitrosarchaeum sp.]|nr:hypothetical protein [Nitrosarchaeum sp.]